MTTTEVPTKMRTLPRDKHDRPVPWFVSWIDGQPDFRVIKPDAIRDAIRFDRCWVCGQRRGRIGTFVIGPMCAVNCARYSAQACPFLTTPAMTRRERHMPEGATSPAGEMIRRNPGVALLWSSKTWKTFTAGNGLLIDIGEPLTVEWYAHGRLASRDEVLASIASGLPLLREMCDQERTVAGREKARAQLDRQHDDAMRLVPA
jgi:hypothetical protein